MSWTMRASCFMLDGTNITSTLYEGGCPAAVKLFQETAFSGDLCLESNSAGVLPITLLCPVSCGCGAGYGLLCPTACRGS